MDSSVSETSVRKISIAGLLICLLGAAFYSYEYLLRICPSVMTSELMGHYNINAPALGALSGSYYWAYVPMQLPVGILMDKIGPRRLLSLACLICVLGTYLFIGSKILWVGFLGRFLVGFGSAFAFVGVLKLAAMWLPQSKFAMFAGLTSALGTIGAMFGDVLLTHWVNTAGWYNTLHYAAIAGIVLAVILYLFIRDAKHPMLISPEGVPEESRSYRELFGILLNPKVWLVGLIGCFIYLPTTVFAEFWGPAYLQHAKFLSAEQAAEGVAFLFMGFTLGAPSFGWLSDFLHTRRKLLMASAISGLCIVSTILYVPNLSVLQINGLLFLLGMSYSAQTLVFTISSELSPSSAEGTAVAVTNMIVMLGGNFLQPLVGLLLDYSWHRTSSVVSAVHVYSLQDYQFAMGLMPVGMVLAFFLTLALRETYGLKK